MTRHGTKLSTITIDDVTARLSEETDGKAVKRLVASREYLDGHSPAEIAEKYGWPEQTIYSWFDRLETRGLDGGLYDDSSPGRPASLTDEEFAAFRDAIRSPPAAVGLDAEEWSTALAKEFLAEEFGQDFSPRHTRRLLNHAGIVGAEPVGAGTDGEGEGES